MNASLMQAGNYVGSPQVSPSWRQSKPSRMARNYVTIAEPWRSNSIYDQFNMTTTVNEIINANASKAPWKANS